MSESYEMNKIIIKSYFIHLTHNEETIKAR